MKKQGFTLIEILVVVLIIGILAAIAVPQYQIAVKKSEVSKVISLVRIMAEQQRLYQLNHGRFAETLDDLDISVIPPKGWGCKTANSGSLINQNNKVECYHSVVNPTISVVYYFDDERNMNEITRQLYCWANSSDSFNRQVCASFGPLINDRYGGARYQIK